MSNQPSNVGFCCKRVQDHQFVKPHRTPWNHDDMRALLQELSPNAQAANILHAKIVLECGRSPQSEGTSCWNHNVGNVRYFGGSMDYTVINGAHEVRADGSIYVPEVNRFRSYNSHRDGVADMLRVLSCQSNFSAAWDVLMHAPDPEAYVRAAKKGRYFTGNVEEYVRAVVSICREFDRRHG